MFKLVKNPEELCLLMSKGKECFAFWKQNSCEFKTAPGKIIAVEGQLILVEHWNISWMLFNDPIIEIRYLK